VRPSIPSKSAFRLLLLLHCGEQKSRTFMLAERRFLEGATKDEIRISKEALFKGVSTQFGPRSIEKCFLRNPDFILVYRSSIFVWEG